MNDLIETARTNVIRFGKHDVAKSPPLKESFAYAKIHAEKVLSAYATYDMVIKDLFSLTPQELATIKHVNEALGKLRGAHEFIAHMQQYKKIILDTVRHAGNTSIPENQQGVEQLATMMQNALEQKQRDPNWKPTDGDPESDEVIWGFVNGARSEKIDIDFTICHGIERIVTARLHKIGITGFIDRKDWLLSAMTDVVSLRGLQRKYPETNLLDLWSHARPHGLGWISDKRLNAFRDELSKSS